MLNPISIGPMVGAIGGALDAVSGDFGRELIETVGSNLPVSPGHGCNSCSRGLP